MLYIVYDWYCGCCLTCTGSRPRISIRTHLWQAQQEQTKLDTFLAHQLDLTFTWTWGSPQKPESSQQPIVHTEDPLDNQIPVEAGVLHEGRPWACVDGR